MIICCPSSMSGEMGLPLSVGTAIFLPSIVTVAEPAMVARLGPVTGIDEVVADGAALEDVVVGALVVTDPPAVPEEPHPPTTARTANASVGASNLEPLIVV